MRFAYCTYCFAIATVRLVANCEDYRYAMPEDALSMVSPENVEGLDLLKQLLAQNADLPKLVSANGQEAELPKPLYDLLRQAVQALASGEPISFVSPSRLLTTNEAADLLNVSRPYLIKLLDGGEIPVAPRVGSHRRVKAQDVLAYKELRDRNRRDSMKSLSSLLQEEGLYDNEAVNG